MSTTPNTVECAAGLRKFSKYSDGVNLWVRSPRTGRELSIGDGWFNELPPRVKGRVAQAMSLGKKTRFTRDELAVLVALEKKIAESLRALRPGNNRSVRSWARR